MRHIIKGKEPRSLLEHRLKDNAGYENVDCPKEDIRKSLLEEQGHICCYCMKRIKTDSMKIEHFKPQSIYPDMQLDYRNMLGACDGNEGKLEHLQCCDTKKGNTEITVNPLLSYCEDLIKYKGDGSIFSEDKTIENELVKVLNLNIKSIKDNRKGVIEAVVKYLTNKYPQKQWTKAMIQKEIDKWSNLDSADRYKEYCQVAIYWLQKLKRKACT